MIKNLFDSFISRCWCKICDSVEIICALVWILRWWISQEINMIAGNIVAVIAQYHTYIAGTNLLQIQYSLRIVLEIMVSHPVFGVNLRNVNSRSVHCQIDFAIICLLCLLYIQFTPKTSSDIGACARLGQEFSTELPRFVEFSSKMPIFSFYFDWRSNLFW